MKTSCREGGAACLGSSTEEEAAKEAFPKAAGIPGRHPETLLGGGVPDVSTPVPALWKLRVYWETQHVLDCSQGQSLLRRMYSDTHASWGSRYVQ